MLFIEFLQNNLGTMLVALIIVAILIPIVVGMIKNKRSGKSSCGCGCASCPMSGKCHAAQNAEKSSDKHGNS